MKKERPIKKVKNKALSKPEMIASKDPVVDQPRDNSAQEIGAENLNIEQINQKETEERKNLIRSLQKLNLEIEQKLGRIHYLEGILADMAAKKVHVNSVVVNIVKDTQLQCTLKLYNYRLQIRQLEQDLKKIVEGKRFEEKKLDQLVALLKEELDVKRVSS